MAGEHHLWSRYFIPTLREEPSDAELASHRLMLRAGLMRRVAHGIFDYLPLGVRVIHKVTRVIREELDAIGCQEVLLPVLSPSDLWEESGRWTVYGKEMMRLTDRHGRQYALGPTHEEVITALVRHEVRSYRELPLTLYQIQTKFRDEVRPRFGVMRGREFLMKDAYSFHATQESLEETYQALHGAYTRIFRRCGLEAVPVEAAGGAIGGSVTHEFTVLAAAGESEILSCPECGYAANTERAEAGGADGAGPPEAEQPLERVHTPGATRVEDVATLLGVPAGRLVKTLLFDDGKAVIAVLVPGDREVSEPKVQALVGRADLELAAPETIERVTGAPVGFSGPVGLGGVRVIADRRLRAGRNVVVGANAADHHLVNANPGRDFSVDEYADVVSARPGDPCPRCGTALVGSRGIEVGQIFQLGTKYSASMNATFLDASGQERPFIMGCYGIGVTRTIAAAIEQHSDVHGIRWPAPLAPFDVHLLPVNVADERVRELASRARAVLLGAGYDVLEDDRDERAGVKFKDADLVGLPARVTVGERAVKSGAVEVRDRRSGETVTAPPDGLPAAVGAVLERAR